MSSTQHTIPIHPLAPPKVPEGQACNGCGICCLFEPCPIGILLSRRRSGSCIAVRWDDPSARYRCGAIIDARPLLIHTLPRGTRWLALLLAPMLRYMGPRWIAAGTGCDSRLQVMAESKPGIQHETTHEQSTTIGAFKSPVPNPQAEIGSTDDR